MNTENIPFMQWSWSNAQEWQHLANKDKTKGKEPQWLISNNFGIDYDGPILSVSSNFRPFNMCTFTTFWEGTVDIFLLSQIIETKGFSNNDLNGTVKDVDKYIKSVIRRLLTNVPIPN